MEQSFSEYALDFLYRVKGDLLFALLLIVCLLISLALRKLALLGFKQNLDGFIGLAITIVATKSLLFFTGRVWPLSAIQVCKRPNFTVKCFFLRHFCLSCNPTSDPFGWSTTASLHCKCHSVDYDFEEPSTIEAFNYCYSFTGLFTGPYYTYQTYYDALHCTHFIKNCLKNCWLNPVDALRGDKINEYGIISLFVWSALAFIYFRMRIYTAWMIAESICYCWSWSVPSQY
uniref:Uncharacterized protein n=1 Tax=Ditylenchus dipsaci TaxID=166011 RepID=A0A915D7M1_9BILA